MSFIKTGKKIAKFTFVTMPLSVFGINHLKMGNAYIRDYWKSLTSPVCPECGKGVLVRSAESADNIIENNNVTTLYPWICNQCQFTFLDEYEPSKVKESARRYRNERIKLELSEMELQECDQIARNHRLHSRLYFFISALITVGFIYMFATGASLLLSLNWLVMALTLWILGMKKSYRAWQVKSKSLFVKGAFWFWFHHEKWII